MRSRVPTLHVLSIGNDRADRADRQDGNVT